MPTVSCLIPVYNMEKWIGQAVASVLAQKAKVEEVLLFDDGSTDGSRAACEALAVENPGVVRLLHSDTNRGGGIAFADMIKEAKGELLLLFAADDLLDENYTEKVLAEFAAHPDALMVACHPRFIDADGNAYMNPQDPRMRIPFPRNMPRDQMLAMLRAGNQYFGVGTYRKTCFEQVGAFSNELQWLLDWDYYIRILKVAPIRIVEEQLCSYRLHPHALSSITSDKIVRQAKYMRTIRQRHFTPTARKVVIATPFYMSLCFSQYKASMIATTNYLSSAGIPWDTIDLNGDSYVDRAKNTIVMKFLEGDGTELLMIDSDMQWSADAVRRVLSYPEEVVAGAFPMKNMWNQFAAWPMSQPDGTPIGRDLGDGSALLKSHRVAGGFLRIHRSALERFANHYEDMVYLDSSADPGCPGRIYTCFFECFRQNFIRFGEDMMFSVRWTAIGGELWTDPNIHFGHYGTNGHYGNYHAALLKTPEEIEKIRKAQEEQKPAAAAA